MKVMNNVLMASLVLGLSLTSVDAGKESANKNSKADRKEVAAKPKAQTSAELVAAIKARNPQANVELIGGNRIKLNGKVTVKADVQAYLDVLQEQALQQAEILRNAFEQDEADRKLEASDENRLVVYQRPSTEYRNYVLVDNSGSEVLDGRRGLDEIKAERRLAREEADQAARNARFNAQIYGIYNDFSARIQEMAPSAETVQAAQAALYAGLTRYLLPTVGLVSVGIFGEALLDVDLNPALLQGTAAAIVAAGNAVYSGYRQVGRVNAPVEESKGNDTEVVSETSLVIYNPADNA